MKRREKYFMPKLKLMKNMRNYHKKKIKYKNWKKK